jgi:pimeloyl-ACP methyl ester carboxylesterase
VYPKRLMDHKDYLWTHETAPAGRAGHRGRIPDLVKDVQFIEVEGGPHNVGWTHPDEVNQALTEFLG